MPFPAVVPVTVAAVITLAVAISVLSDQMFLDSYLLAHTAGPRPPLGISCLFGFG